MASLAHVTDMTQVVGLAPELALHHFTELHDDSGISQDVIASRGAYTAITPQELSELGFANSQLSVPALVLPEHNLDGSVRTYTIEPDRPRQQEKPGAGTRTMNGCATCEWAMP